MTTEVTIEYRTGYAAAIRYALKLLRHFDPGSIVIERLRDAMPPSMRPPNKRGRGHRMVERNASIYRQRLAGVPFATLSVEYDISEQRVREIFRDETLRRFTP